MDFIYSVHEQKYNVQHCSRLLSHGKKLILVFKNYLNHQKKQKTKKKKQKKKKKKQQKKQKNNNNKTKNKTKQKQTNKQQQKKKKKKKARKYKRYNRILSYKKNLQTANISFSLLTVSSTLAPSSTL